jgi:YbbR domain-containing protein
MGLGWIVTNWRLKLLALLLAVGLLGAVAFSENPPAFENVQVRVQYVNLPANLVLTDYRDSVNVPVIGLRNAVDRYAQSAAGVSIDMSNAKPGSNQLYVAQPRVDTPGVSPQASSIPIRLSIERLETRQLDVEVRTPNRAPGIQVVPERTYASCGNASDRCLATVSAAQSLVDSLKAYVKYDVPITGANTQTSPNEPIQFEQNAHTIDLSKLKTIPRPSWTPNVVTVQVVAQGGNLTKTVGLTVKPTGTQACGYAIVGVDIQPTSFITVTGPSDSVAKMGPALTLDPVNISGIAATQHYSRQVPTPDQVNSSPLSVTVVVSVAQTFSCSAPSPVAAQPALTPAATPTPTAQASP